MRYPEFLTAKDLMNHLYCERIPYFEHVLKVPQVTTKKEYVGRTAHEDFNKESKRLKLDKAFEGMQRHYDLFLEDDELNFRTIVDCLLVSADGSKAYVLQIKNSPEPPVIYKGQRMQLAAEAYLVRKLLHYPTSLAFINYLKSDTMVRVYVGPETEVQLKSTLDVIRNNIKSESMPPPTPYKKKCPDCCFFKICKRV
ncbi:MAG: CRISPR-associated protein Cas4 [Candidatus Micrarchaeota archaeon]